MYSEKIRSMALELAPQNAALYWKNVMGAKNLEKCAMRVYIWECLRK